MGKTETVANAGVRGDECTVEFEGDCLTLLLCI